MKDKILDQLRLIETTHGVKIIHAVESGSRVWGFDSPNSDYDVRFIYTRPINWYLGVFERRDVIELPIDGLLDINGWDLKKALFLISKSNPVLHEWLNSPIVYHTNPVIIFKLTALAADYFNAKSAIYHYLNLASGNYNSYIKGKDCVQTKKYLYIIRALLSCVWIEKSASMPPVQFEKLIEHSDSNWVIKKDLQLLLDRKKSSMELDMDTPIASFNNWIEEKLEHFTTIARTAAVGKPKSDDLNDFLLYTLWGEL